MAFSLTNPIFIAPLLFQPGYFGIPLMMVLGLLIMMVVVFSVFSWQWQFRRIKSLETQNQELLISNKALNQYAYASSHDLKGKLRTMGSFSSLLRMKYQDILDDDGKQYLGFITNSANQMSQMLSDLLDYTKLANKKRVSMEEIDMNAVLNQVIDACTCSPTIRSAQFDIDDLPVMVTNRSFIHQLFQNLISNGLKYNENNIPIIEIRYQLVENNHRFQIKDNGIGIPKHSSEKIFEPFHRLHKEDYQGTGLGLAICQHIVECLKGSIQVDSYPGVGTSFVVSIPKTEI